MAKYDNATLKIDSGNYFRAPVGTAAPVNLLAPDAAWENIGHTSLDSILSVSSEGGEATVLGTLQSKSLRTSYSARSETLKFTIQQWDSGSLKLYFGANMNQTADSRFYGVPDSPQPTQSAFLVVFIDGANVFAIYCPKAEIMRADDMELADTESLAGLPINVKPLVHNTNTWTWAITPINPAPAPTGATQGAPGSFTPVGSYTPYNLAGLAGVVASPTTKWTVGNYVNLQDGTKAYWNATAWTAGVSV